jgi:dipeptidyl aminopeptidase/acylaminoacyl peptidase
MKKKLILPLTGAIIILGVITIYTVFLRGDGISESSGIIEEFTKTNEGGLSDPKHPIEIEEMRRREYPESNIVIEQTLTDKANYKQFITSYKSDGLKIFGLLTIPKGDIPEGGWPAIIFNHGFIQPTQYVTTQRYEDYVNGFAKNRYIVFKPDYRGHGNSEGRADGNYFSPGYTVDVLNALASIKRFKDVNPERIGMWGHSMGGNITMRNLVISKDIKAVVIWAGVVGSYDDILNNWSRARRWRSSTQEHRHQGPSRQTFLDKFGSPEDNPEFWEAIDPHSFIGDITTPVQLHHGTGDTHVPISFSENFKQALENEGKSVEFFTYEGADHNLSGASFNTAMKRSVDFFDRYLKLNE